MFACMYGFDVQDNEGMF